MAAPIPSDGPITGINVTPFVDIVLVLLVIFIVTARILVTPAVHLELPHAAKARDTALVFSIVLPAEGPRTLNGAPIASDAALLAEARDAARRDPEMRALIQADGAVSHRDVMRVIDVLQGAGVEHIAFGAVRDGGR